MKNTLPKIIFITGSDGAGKSRLTRFLHCYLEKCNIKNCVVWSRFHNYFSKPILGISRLTGHNHYEKFGDVKFGFHNFESIPFFGWLFVFLQSIDVNIAAFFNITRIKSKFDVIICERGPWDTMSDVMADTGLRINPNGIVGKLFLMQTSNAKVVYVKRSKKNIINTRPELVHDYKLSSKIQIYDYLHSKSNWLVVDNNNTIYEAEYQLKSLLKLV